MIKKLLTAFAALLLTICIVADTALATPYNGYIYNARRGDGVFAPNAYIPEITIYGREMHTTALNSPSDFSIRNGKIYIADTNNNRIVILDENYDFLSEISEFVDDSGDVLTLNAPEGIYVTAKNEIYVCDTQNRRIIVFNKDGTFKKIISQPVSDVIPENFQYFPVKVSVDYADRVFVIGRGVFNGIIEFDTDGNFVHFLGTNRVSFNIVDYFWKSIATYEQRERMAAFVPTAFNNVEVDELGFIYTTVAEEGSNYPIQRLNPSGVNVLREVRGVSMQKGDIDYVSVGARGVTYTGSSVFNDISVNEYGMYTVLDSKRGRIFTYSDEGQLMYVFGKYGIQEGTFGIPVALSWHGDKIVVLDKSAGSLTIFEPTEYGRSINDAIRYYHTGEEEKSTASWETVLTLNSNYDMAYAGIGKALLREGDYKEAMRYLQLGNNRFHYSKAFSKYRKEILRDNLGFILTGIIFVSVAAAAFVIYKRRIKEGDE